MIDKFIIKIKKYPFQTGIVIGCLLCLLLVGFINLFQDNGRTLTDNAEIIREDYLRMTINEYGRGYDDQLAGWRYAHLGRSGDKTLKLMSKDESIDPRLLADFAGAVGKKRVLSGNGNVQEKPAGTPQTPRKGVSAFGKVMLGIFGLLVAGAGAMYLRTLLKTKKKSAPRPEFEKTFTDAPVNVITPEKARMTETNAPDTLFDLDKLFPQKNEEPDEEDREEKFTGVTDLKEPAEFTIDDDLDFGIDADALTVKENEDLLNEIFIRKLDPEENPAAPAAEEEADDGAEETAATETDSDDKAAAEEADASVADAAEKADAAAVADAADEDDTAGAEDAAEEDDMAGAEDETAEADEADEIEEIAGDEWQSEDEETADDGVSAADDILPEPERPAALEIETGVFDLGSDIDAEDEADAAEDEPAGPAEDEDEPAAEPEDDEEAPDMIGEQAEKPLVETDSENDEHNEDELLKMIRGKADTDHVITKNIIPDTLAAEIAEAAVDEEEPEDEPADEPEDEDAADNGSEADDADDDTDGADDVLIHYQSSYRVGNDMYDEVFSIDQGDIFRGECGIGIGETLNNTEPKAVTAFEVWLFDKDDIHTSTTYLVSDFGLANAGILDRLQQHGRCERIRRNGAYLLETETLQVEIRVLELEYGTEMEEANSYFTNVTFDVIARSKGLGEG